jgi:16S rRNA (cytidine1402-2'-O)-methyltransferase
MKDIQRLGTLFVVATPIGNLEDISNRALRTLEEVDLIACEDTRHTRKLLNHFKIDTPLTSYYREKERYKTEIILKKLQEGMSIALVSDAGTPAISDPGSILIQAAREAGITITPIPGASALTTALSISGINGTSFFFGGFLPAKTGERKKNLQKLTAMTCPLVFYESPHRIKNSLEDCKDVLGDRQSLLCRELTKIHEESLGGSLSEVIQLLPHKIKGELVLIIYQTENVQEDKPDNIEELLRWYKERPDYTLKDAVSQIAADLDLSRSLVYKKALAIWKK